VKAPVLPLPFLDWAIRSSYWPFSFYVFIIGMAMDWIDDGLRN